VQDQIGELLRQAGQLLVPSGALDLATLERVFTLRAHDALSAAIAPALVSDVLRSAPGVRLRFLAETTHDTDELRHAAVDLELGSSVPTAPELRYEPLGFDPLLVVLRRGHLATARLDLAAYAALPHVVVSRRGRLTDPVDAALGEHGTQRLVVASVGTIAAAAQIVAGTDAVLTAPGRVIETVTAAFDLITRPVPLTLPAPQVISVWHQRSDSDAAHTWLRDRVRATMGALLEKSSSR